MDIMMLLEILEFIEKYLDKDKLFDSMMKNKLERTIF